MSTEARLHALLTAVWRTPLRVKGDYARANADIVALAASSQLITTRVSKGTFSNSWQITTKGLTHMHQKDS